MIIAEIFPYAHVVYNVFLVLYALTVLGVIAVVLSENRNPVKSLAWVTVLLLLPVLGLVLYLFFGRSLKGLRMISRRNKRMLQGDYRPNQIAVGANNITSEAHQLMRITNTLAGAHCYAGNHIQVFTSGDKKFEALKRDLRQAERYIHLQYYIIENDEIGREIRDILEKKAREGVKVRVTYDHVGSFTFNASYFNHLRHAGVEAYPFLKITITELANRLNWRNHRKIVVIDGKVGYIGGMNIADRYVTGEHHQLPWRDTHLRIQGPAVAGLQYTFAVDWNFMKRSLLTDEMHVIDTQPRDGGDTMQILPSGPTDKWNNISLLFIKAIMLAKHRVYIQTPYFLPNDALLKALQTTALAGVDVRLMIPRNPDSKLLKHATASYLKQCLVAGIKVYFYEPTVLHAKVLIIDDDFVTTGSTNFDFRSFEHNFECNALVYSKAFNEQMREIFEADQRQCTRLILSHWRRRPVTTKAVESILRLMAPLL